MLVLAIEKAVHCPLFDNCLMPVARCGDCDHQRGYGFVKGTSGNKFGPICAIAQKGYEYEVVPTLEEDEEQ